MMHIHRSRLGASHLLLLVVLSAIGLVVNTSAPALAQASGTWTLTGSMNTPRAGHQAVLLAHGQALVVDGEDVSSAGTFNLTSTEVYNPATGAWTTTGNTFHAGNSAFTVTLLGTGKVLIAGGITGVYPHTHITSAAELYDPATATSASDRAGHARDEAVSLT